MKGKNKILMNEFAWLTLSWRAALKIGYNSEIAGLEKSRVMLLNGIIVVTSLSVLLFSVVYFAIDYPYYYGPLYFLPLGFIILYLNHQQKYTSARNVYLAGSLIIISYWCYEGRGNGNEYTLVALATTTTLIFDRKRIIYLANFCCACVYVLYKIYDATQPFIPEPSINYQVVPVLILLNSVGVISFQIAFFRDLVDHYDDKFVKKYNELNDALEKQKITEEQVHASNEELRTANEKLHDLTKQLELMVKQKSIELQTYIEAINVNMYSSITDLNGNFLMVNEPLVIASGYSREELIGKHYNTLATVSYQHASSVERRNMLLSGKTWRGEVEHKNKNGSFYWFDCVVIPLRDKDDTIKYFLSLGLPVTERKLHEKMQEKTQRVLEMIAFRTSHKIRGPLARIKGLTNLIQRDLIKGAEIVLIAEKLSICTEELNTATSELVSFVYDHQKEIIPEDE